MHVLVVVATPTVVIAIVKITTRAPGAVERSVAWTTPAGATVVLIDLIVVAATPIVIARIAGAARTPKVGNSPVTRTAPAALVVVLGYCLWSVPTS